jgi:hypothetical protein
MASVLARAGMMESDDMNPKILAAVVRLTTWLLPQHRKEWAEAMFNEMPYLESRQAATFWVLGATLFAIKERASYELMSMLTPRAISKALLGPSLAIVITVMGVYLMQKPYQRERILLLVFHGCGKSGCPLQ